MREGPEKRRRADEAALLDGAARLRSPADAVVVTTDDGTVTAATRSLGAVMGLAPAELRGATLLDHVHPEDAPRLLEAARLAADAPGDPVIVRVRHGNGSWRDVELLAGPAVDGATGTVAVVLRDVSAVEALRRARRAVEARSRALLERGGDLVAVVESDGRLRDVSPGSARALGRHPDSLRGRNVADMIHPDDLPRVQAFLADRSPPNGWNGPFDLRFRHADGSWRVLEVEVENHLADETVRAAVVAARDVSARRHAENLVLGQQRVLDALARRDPAGAALDAVAQLVAGRSDRGRAAVLVREGDGTLRLAAAPGMPDDWVRAAARLPDLPPATAPGAVRPFEGRGADVAARQGLGMGWSRAVLDRGSGRDLGEIVVFTGAKRFITASEQEALEVGSTLAAVVLGRAEDERRIEAALGRDRLTGLATRERFQDALLDRCRRNESVLVAVADVDDFVALNAAIGYGGGDLVLRTLAQRLASAVRNRDVAARLGDDEFGVVGTTTDLESARRIGERLHTALRVPVEVRGDRVEMRVSVGLALGGSAPEPDVVLARAEHALARARAAGGDVVIIDGDPGARTARRSGLAPFPAPDEGTLPSTGRHPGA